MDSWPPSFVDALAEHHRVVVFDNAGIGQTAALRGPLSIDRMADQTSAFITSLQLHHPAVLGWSMGGMIAQALAVRHPGKVGHLVLTATYPGDGSASPLTAAGQADLQRHTNAAFLRILFPPGQRAAARDYVREVDQYTGFYVASPATKEAQDDADGRWTAGLVSTGYEDRKIRAPTLVADGREDVIDPTPNDRVLARSIKGAELALYPDAGHGFLFQDASRFVRLVDSFLARR